VAWYNIEAQGTDIYLNEFLSDARIRNIKIMPVRLTIKFKETPANILAYCHYYIDHTRTIEIDERKWNNLSFNSKKLLIYHELGHCLLLKPHDNEKSEIYGYPQSIMNSYIFAGSWFELNEISYIDQLFGLKKKALE